MTSWKTTVTGVAAILTAVGAALTALFDNDPATNIDIAVTVAAVMSGIGLIFARDNNVTSEDAGAK
jgi:hypothetical protein